MDTHEHWFDNLLRSMAAGTSRRTALRTLGAGAAGGFLALMGVSGSAADGGRDDCKRAGKACKKDLQCCSGMCVNGVCLSGPCEPCRTDQDCTAGNLCDQQYGLCVPFLGYPDCPTTA
jgi:Dickkopf N-terminal cysteine-rich region